MPHLHEILAVEKGVKTRVNRELSDLHKSSQKADLHNGMHKTYEKNDEDGPDFPDEDRVVQLIATEVLRKGADIISELIDVQATKDIGNTKATADVVVDGRTLVEGAPATLLLFLEKELTDYRTFIQKIPTLDQGEIWETDPNSKTVRSQPRKTHKTQKVQKPVVLFPATKEHPAQTQLITEDQIIGYWTSVKHSGAIGVPQKEKLLGRVNKLLDAVKKARAKANMLNVEKVDIADSIFGYLLEG